MRVPWILSETAIVDRAAHRRADAELAAAAAVVVSDGAVLARGGALVRLPASERPPHRLEVYLGRDGEHDLVAIVPAEDPVVDGAAMTPLRDLLRGFALRGAEGDRDREVAASAVAISMWHASHPRCALCGEPTEVRSAGWVRHCVADGKDHYPRTDPAVIAAITDPADRLLLAHASYWSAGRYSHLAGYVEPGESLEQALHREVAEEAGLRLRDVEYVGSQPWPFPSSVMVAFRARVDDPTLVLDRDEIDDAMWVTRTELDDAVASGVIATAPLGSIAHRLLEDWRHGPVSHS